MKRKPTIQLIIIAGISLLWLISCKYDEVLPPEPDPGIQVSFNGDILPIFNSGCNISGCHNGSGHTPDLRAQVAYANLFSGNFIDTIIPDQSELYLWMSGERGLPMPVEGVNATYTSTVLQWIKQGAKKN